MKLRLVTQAWFQLLYVDLVGILGFKAIRRLVPPCPNGHAADISDTTVDEVIEAVSLARMLYIKPVFCLQNSTAVTRLLRRRGIAAEMIIGCHLAPIRAHAWVEVDGKPITEWNIAMQHYCILDRW